MNIIPNFYFGISGFVIWYLLAPRKKVEGQPFLAYTIALLISLLMFNKNFLNSLIFHPVYELNSSYLISKDNNSRLI